MHFLISDGHPEPYEISVAQEKRLPLLSVEWVVQMLIAGGPIDPDDNSEYTVDDDYEIRENVESSPNNLKKKKKQ